MCESMVGIQSATAEIRRGENRKKETTGQKYNGLPYSIGPPININTVSILFAC